MAIFVNGEEEITPRVQSEARDIFSVGEGKCMRFIAVKC